MATDDSATRNHAIANGEIEIVGRFVDASNATLLGEIKQESGDDIKVVYKPTAGERPLWDFPDSTLARREVAAFALSSLLGWNLVPFTCLRGGPFGEGMVQEWIATSDEFDLVAFSQSDHPQLRRMALFDAVMNNTDRKIGHILVSEKSHVYGCDHGLTFHVEPKLRTVLWQWGGEAFTSEEMTALESLPEQINASSLLELLATEEIEETLRRIDQLRESGSFPFPSSEWPAIPWPPY